MNENEKNTMAEKIVNSSTKIFSEGKKDYTSFKKAISSSDIVLYQNVLNLFENKKLNTDEVKKLL